MKSVLIALFVVWFSAMAGAQEAGTALRIARYETGGEQPPMQAMVEAALRAAGMAFIYVDIPNARVLIEADKGVMVDADLARAREALSAFPHLVVVDEPVYRFQLSAFVLKSAPPVVGWQSLLDRAVVVNAGSVVLDRLLGQHRISNVTRADSYTNAARMLQVGHGDVVILPLDEGRKLFERLGARDVVASGPLLVDVPLYFVVNSRFSEFVPAIEREIRRQKTAGDGSSVGRAIRYP